MSKLQEASGRAGGLKGESQFIVRYSVQQKEIPPIVGV